MNANDRPDPNDSAPFGSTAHTPLGDSRETSPAVRVPATISADEFFRADLRVGTVLSCEPALGARKPAWRLRIDFGPELGLRHSSAQLTAFYRREDLVGRQVIAVVNLPPRRIAGFVSEVLVTGFELPDGAVVLASVERPVPDGTRMS